MRFTGREFKKLIEESKRRVIREWVNNNINAKWNSSVVSKQEIEDAINNEDPIYVNYFTKTKGEHERVFIPTSVMYSSIKDRYRVLGIDLNKSNNQGRVAFILDRISDWQNMNDGQDENTYDEDEEFEDFDEVYDADDDSYKSIR